MKICFSARTQDVSKTKSNNRVAYKTEISNKDSYFKFEKAKCDLLKAKAILLGSSISEPQNLNTATPVTYHQVESKFQEPKVEEKATTPSDIELLDDKIKVILIFLDIIEYYQSFVSNKFSFEDLLLMEKTDLVEIAIPVMPRNRLWFFLSSFKQSNYSDVMSFMDNENQNKGSRSIMTDTPKFPEEKVNINSKRSEPVTRPDTAKIETYRRNLSFEEIKESSPARREQRQRPPVKITKTKGKAKLKVAFRDLDLNITEEERQISHKVDCLAKKKISQPYLADYYRNVEGQIKKELRKRLPEHRVERSATREFSSFIQKQESSHFSNQYSKRLRKNQSCKNLFASNEISFSNNEDVSELKRESSLGLSVSNCVKNSGVLLINTE